MQTYTICEPESPSCANSIDRANYSTDDHSLDNYIKLKAIQEPESGKNIRSYDKGLENWQEVELEKLNEIFGIFGEQFTFKPEFS